MLRRYESKLIEDALRVLLRAARQSGLGLVDSDEVRLALRVLIPFVESRRVLDGFWRNAGANPNAKQRIGCLGDYESIKRSLSLGGWDCAVEDVPVDPLAICSAVRLDADCDALLARYGADDYGGKRLDRVATPVQADGWTFAISRNAYNRALDVRRWGFPRRIMTDAGPREIAVGNVSDPWSTYWDGVLRSVGSRCIIPASAYVETVEASDGSRVMHEISVPSSPIFSIAAVCRRHPREGVAFAIMTCPANALVAAVQPVGMPAILLEEDEDRWLRGMGNSAIDAIGPFPSQMMAISPG